MGLFRKMKASLRSDWCSDCQEQMETIRKQLFALPQYVGHYQGHKEPEYYQTHLTPVGKKAEIPTGMYACGAKMYRCPQCGRRLVHLSIFLPVRDQEKYEDSYCFERGELDGLFGQL